MRRTDQANIMGRSSDRDYYFCIDNYFSDTLWMEGDGRSRLRFLDMDIRKTDEKDLARITEIYAFARDYMASHGNPNQWGPTNWPPVELLREDIRQGHSYVCEDNGEIVGTFYFNKGENIEPTYKIIADGSWLNGDAYGVVHRIASDGSRKGVGEFCLNWAYEQCRHLRIDTHPDNKTMQGLLLKLGFEKCGIIYVEEDDYPRYAFEKV